MTLLGDSHSESAAGKLVAALPPRAAGGVAFNGYAACLPLLSAGSIDPESRCAVFNRGGDYLFVHAGIRPGVSLDRQSRRDLLWIRDSFLLSTRDHGVVVVHGHTVSESVEDRGNRIGIDTGAYATGRLTALGLEGDARWTLST